MPQYNEQISMPSAAFNRKNIARPWEDRKWLCVLTCIYPKGRHSLFNCGKNILRHDDFEANKNHLINSYTFWLLWEGM